MCSGTICAVCVAVCCSVFRGCVGAPFEEQSALVQVIGADVLRYEMLQCVLQCVLPSVLQSVLQYVLQCVAVCYSVCCGVVERQSALVQVFGTDVLRYDMLQCVLLCVLPCVFQCVAVCCSVLQCAAVCCSVLQCTAVCCSMCERQSALVQVFGTDELRHKEDIVRQ